LQPSTRFLSRAGLLARLEEKGMQKAEVRQCVRFVGLTDDFEVDEMKSVSIVLGYKPTLLSLLRDFLKNDELVLRSKITKDSKIVSVTDFGKPLENDSVYALLLPSDERFQIKIL
jgi:hypothetical protein